MRALYQNLYEKGLITRFGFPVQTTSLKRFNQLMIRLPSLSHKILSVFRMSPACASYFQTSVSPSSNLTDFC